MFIVIHCSGLPFNGQTVANKSLGGSETAAYYIAKGLAAKGHTVEVWGTLAPEEEEVSDGVRYCHIGNQTPQTPLGDRFEFYAQNTPCDALIIQRSPAAFMRDFPAKLKILWCHDLAVVRNRTAFLSSLANCDAVFTVSEFHKEQLATVYNLKKEQRDVIYPVTNGVDLSLYNAAREKLAATEISKARANTFAMIYQSRPERGLDNLVRPGGVMDQLAELRPEAHLYVCSYQHDVPGLNPLYDFCNERIEELPNCTNLGTLSKPELAVAQCSADLWIYPTEFEEVSCITAMEMMAAFTPGISSKHGALPETCKNRGVTLFPLTKDGVNERRFVNAVVEWTKKDTERALPKLKEGALHFDWTTATERFEKAIYGVRDQRQRDGENILALANHLARHSDVVALNYLINCVDGAESVLTKTLLGEQIIGDYERCFSEWPQNEALQAQHYENYYESYAVKEGWLDDTTLLNTNPRVEELAQRLECLEPGQLVLDYGCFNGAFSITLAQRFPQHRFVGVDCSAAVIEHAVEWAADLELDNVGFHTVSAFEEQESLKGQFDVLIAGEILEHVWDYRTWFELRIAPWLNRETSEGCGAFLYFTTPFGPWEWQSFDKYDPYRFHLWHFERGDLELVFADQDDVEILTVPQGQSRRGELLGCHLIFATYTGAKLAALDLAAKLKRTVPADTLALNMIVKDGEEKLRATLNSVRWLVDAVYIGVDQTTTDNTEAVINNFAETVPTLPVHYFKNPTPTAVGFDEARNRVLDETDEAWILMLDADETLSRAEELQHLLREGAYKGFAIAQHHFSLEPLGVLDTDYPCRLFRNDGQIKYEGVVHEHPERGDNEGAGAVIQVPHVQIAHTSYTTEAHRRDKFHRNISLMARDREKYPNRILGAFLWIRDLALMCRFELEHTNGAVTHAMRERAHEGLRLWEAMVKLEHPMIPRLVSDGLQFYTTLTEVLGGGFDFACRLSGSKLNGGADIERAPTLCAHFLNRKHLDTVLRLIVNEETKDYDSKYF